MSLRFVFKSDELTTDLSEYMLLSLRTVKYLVACRQHVCQIAITTESFILLRLMFSQVV